MMFVALNLHLVNDAISFLLFLPGPELESAEVMNSGYLSRLPLMWYTYGNLHSIFW
jgi:hypothetical protein